MRIVRKVTVATTVLGLGAAVAVAGTPAQAAPVGHVHEIVARMGAKHIHLSSMTVRAGTERFAVVSGDGGVHLLQLARLHPGYSLQQASRDLPKAFHGQVPAVRRVDRNVNFRGGAAASKGKLGQLTVNLFQGHYVLFDQDSSGVTFLTVRGAGSPARVPHDGVVTTYTYGFGNSQLPASGAITFRNISDQPHFVVFNRVKTGTTGKQVARFFHHGAQGKPSFAKPAHTAVGVISPGTRQLVQIDLPPGRYVLACFWPDDDTGMPHAFMGMWKLVTLH